MDKPVSSRPFSPLDLDRRDFVTAGTAAALTFAFGGRQMLAEELVPPPSMPMMSWEDEIEATPVKVGVIGLGEQGRALLSSLSYAPGTEVVQACDSFEEIHRKSKELAPKTAFGTEYRKVLDDPAVQAVFVATPTHLHKEIVLNALAAGKHVYCEAPLAHTIEDARAIAQAAQKVSGKQVFQSGLQYRANAQHRHVFRFVRSTIGGIVMGRAQWHQRTSWRRMWPDEARAKALNWRLDKETSQGLAGEVGIHQFDIFSLYRKALPVSVSGFGGIMAWKDGRTVPDTIQCMLEYPGEMRVQYSATLACSFDGSYELIQGPKASILCRELRAWMFKEADAEALGWEVYAFREKVGDALGISLVANATKILDEDKNPADHREVDPKRTPLYFSCEAFLNCIRAKKKSPLDEKAGFTATVTAIKTNEAVVGGKTIVFDKAWFEY